MKKFLFVFIAISLIIMIPGCGAAEKKLPDLDKLSQDLLNDSGIFTDILNPIDQNIALVLFGLNEEDVESCTVYCSTGATAEEIALFIAPDADAAKRIYTALERRVEMQILAFENYVPAEVPKLKNAILRNNGLWVAYITASNIDSADKIVYNYENG